jgi:hypothetical protein
MKNFLVRKIFEYDPTFDGRFSRYRGYDLITSQRRSPEVLIKKKAVNLSGLSLPIFCSSLKRGKKTALLFGSEIKSLDELKEVRFSLRSLVTEKEFKYFGSNLVRERFVKAFMADTLIDRRSVIKQELDRLLMKLKKLPTGSYLVISHSFKMKILEIYLQHPDLFQNPKLLRSYFNTYKKTYNFGEGFEFELK